MAHKSGAGDPRVSVCDIYHSYRPRLENMGPIAEVRRRRLLSPSPYPGGRGSAPDPVGQNRKETGGDFCSDFCLFISFSL